MKIRPLFPLIIIPFMLTKCGGPPKKVEMPAPVKETPALPDCTPKNLSAQSGDGKLFLKWDTNCPDSILLSGYNVYLLKNPLDKKYFSAEIPQSIKPFNDSPYPGDTDPNSKFETIEIERLDNAVEYFVTVRTVFPDGRLSPASNEVSAICRPEGEFSLAFRYADLNDGFSFEKGKSVRADASDNDIYFYEKDGFDFFASPHRLNGFLRQSGFYSLGKTNDIYQYPKLEIDFPAVEKIPVIVGESYLVETADKNFVKLRIEEASGTDKERKLKIKYVYQIIKGLTRF